MQGYSFLCKTSLLPPPTFPFFILYLSFSTFSYSPSFSIDYFIIFTPLIIMEVYPILCRNLLASIFMLAPPTFPPSTHPSIHQSIHPLLIRVLIFSPLCLILLNPHFFPSSDPMSSRNTHHYIKHQTTTHVSQTTSSLAPLRSNLVAPHDTREGESECIVH